MNFRCLRFLRWLPATVFRYRGLIRAIVVKELVGRYNGSLLGPLWLIIPPLFMVFIYTVVFAQLMGSRLPGLSDTFGYSIYLCAGLLVWTPFLDAMQRSRGVFLEHANLIKKTAFPRSILFVPVILVAGINLALFSVAFFGFLFFTKFSVAALVWMPLCALVALLLGVAVGAVLAVLNVFFRDIGQGADLAVQLLFWATPIVYPASILPKAAAEWLGFNPMYPLVRASQTVATGIGQLDVLSLAYPVACALGVMVLASLLFARAQADLMDRI